MKSRQLIRKQGWVPVKVDALQIKDISTKPWHLQSLEEQAVNAKQYSEIINWCKNTLGEGNYVCTLQRGGMSDCEKRFAFKLPKHATLFRMRWCS